MKKFLILLYLMVFSLSFTGQYEITKKASVKMTQSEMEQNALDIEKSVKETFTQNGLANYFERVLEKKNSENLEDEFYARFYSEIFNLLSLKGEVMITKIEFLSDKEVELTAKYRAPTISVKSTPKFERAFENEFKRKMGYPISKVNGKILTQADREKIYKLTKDVAKRVVGPALRKPIYNGGESKETMEKVGNK